MLFKFLACTNYRVESVSASLVKKNRAGLSRHLLRLLRCRCRIVAKWDVVIFRAQDLWHLMWKPYHGVAFCRLSRSKKSVECPALKKNLGPVVLAIFVFYTKIILFVPNKIVPYRLVRRETLAATEGELYLAVLRWAQHRIAAGLEDNLRHPAIAD